MKKKITAVFLTLCLVLGLLPLSAMAQTYLTVFGRETIELRGNDTDGYKVVGATEKDQDGLFYYTFYKGRGMDADKFTYYIISGLGEDDGEHTITDPQAPTFVRFDLTLNPNGGTVNGSREPIIVEPNAQGQLFVPTPIREGYEFLGWYDELEGGIKYDDADGQVFLNGKDTTLYAHWYKEEDEGEGESKIYTVTLNLNGEGAKLPAGTAATLTTGKDGTLASLPTPTWEDHAFNGWYTAKTGGTKVTTKTVFEKDATIYAQWEKVTEIKADTQTETDGDVTVAVSAVEVEKGWAKKTTNGTTVFIDAGSSSGGADAVKVEINSDSMKELAELNKSSVRIDTDRGRFVLKPADVKKLAKLDVDNIALEIGKTEDVPSGLTPPKTKRAAFNGSVVVSLTDGTTTRLDVTGLGITVYVKADLTVVSGRKAAVWYDGSSLEKQSGADYDGELLKWTLTHS